MNLARENAPTSHLLALVLAYLNSVCHQSENPLILCVSGSADASIVYAFGFNKRGQLGIPTNTNSCGGNNKWRVSSPQTVDSLDMHGVTSVSADGDHSAVLTGRFKQFVLVMLFILFLKIECMFPM